METTNNQKPTAYLAHLEFISGEYGQPFMKCFRAHSREEAEKKLQEYLLKYYSDADVKQEGNIYYYFDGEIAVKCNGIEEIFAPTKDAYDYLLTQLTHAF